MAISMLSVRASRARWPGVALTLAVVVVCLAGGAVNDRAFAQIEFGPKDGGGVTEHSLSRQFIREWEGNPELGVPTLAMANIEPTKAAIKRFTAIVEAGGWKTVPDVDVKPGETHFAVTVLRDRLLVSGELAEDSGAGETYDTPLVEAVKAFQAANGLPPTGRVDTHTTIPALNVPADARLKQLKNNLTRLTELASVVKGHKKYVAVNIPAAQIEAVALNRVISRHAGVVGKPERPTPLLRSTITEMNFNPIWRLPPTVIDKDLIPQGRELQASGKSILVKMGIDAYDGSGKKVDPMSIDWASNRPKSLSYRQQPGKENPLGFVKINFASSESVYMHDTPSETLFGRNFRAASSGCIRVANVEKLAYWLLGQNDGWEPQQIEEMKATGKRLDVKLATPVPLYFIYITAWATENGAVQFRRDLYNKDGIGEAVSAY
jgi:murein L,D-transpeptidase YcbB/YkuD